jgi:hypothetical protein
MNAVQSIISSPRATRALFWLGAAVLAAGVVVLVVAFVGRGDGTTTQPDKGFRAALPVKSQPLRTDDGVKITKYTQLDPEVKSNIRTFLASAVARKHLGDSWAVIAPSMKEGYTYKQWRNAKALPVIPYPIDNVDHATYSLEYATTKEILVEVGLSAPPKRHIRPATFRLGLVPVGKGTQARWLVNYWMPRWTPPIPIN